MKKNPTPLGLLSKDERQKAVDGIISFFRIERGEMIGIIAAGDLLDHFEEHAGILIYNRAIEEARGVLQKALEDGDAQLDVLKR